jgi:ketosteroid isomerase-like protein
MTIPAVIAAYQAAHDQHDTETALASFTADATVKDDGHEYHGTDEIRTWLSTAASEFTFTRTFVSAEDSGGDTWLVVNHIAGNFPGSPVDLRYEFAMRDGLIAELVIAP